MTEREKKVKRIVQDPLHKGIKMNTIVGYGDGSFTVYVSSTNDDKTTRKHLRHIQKDLELAGYAFAGIEYQLVRKRRRKRR